MFIPAVTLLILTFVGTNNKDVVIVLLVISVAINAGTHCGMTLNHIDLSPVHAGTLMALTNSVASILAILAPLTIGGLELLTDYKEVSFWNHVS